MDWSLLHKCNGWAMCIYGNWPFTLPGYEETTLDLDSFYYDPQTGKKTPYRFTHKNIKQEFLPDLIRYANARGVKMYAYIGKNEKCYQTFWEPWAKTYGFKSIAETDPNHPPIGVRVGYYTWLFKTFDHIIQKHAQKFGRPLPEIYLISHILLSRLVGESKSQAERDRWFAYIDEKQGRKVPFVILEADESKYVSFLGHDRVASLGGRGGSCTCAMFRIASINNDWCGGGMGGDLAYERACQKHLYEAGGFGAMGYIFEWTNTEVFGYIASQYLWRNAGVPGINNDDQTGFLYYAYPAYYGDQVGRMAARILDEGSDVNDQMILEGIYGAQYPSTGQPLHRDYQLLAAIADRAVRSARQAYLAYTGNEPDLWHRAQLMFSLGGGIHKSVKALGQD